MKPTLLSKFRPQARPIAELMWGRGGTNAMKTTRRGAYYFSCSSHGGYLVCAKDLTDAERRSLDPYIKPQSINLIVQTQKDGKDYVVGVDNTPMSNHGTAERTYRYNRLLGPVRWETFEMYAFEEDCAWAILEKFTPIRLKEEVGNISQEYLESRATQVESTFNRYYAKK